MMQIEFVSDIVCPWCAIGLASLEQALAQVGPEIGPVSLRFQPFELNPQMPPEGEEIAGHLSRKYGRSREELAGAAQMIQQRAEALGFPMRTANRTRIWNTFDGHRLLHWAGTVGETEQKALKQALLLAYHRDGLNPADPAVLRAAAAEAGLDAAEAAAVIDDPQRYAAEVRQEQALWQQAGIHSVPAVVINRQYLVSGGQPPEVFAQALRQAAGAAAA
ncbi:DsbA family oxidoreductase [Ideonella alba]|nr:DsbA family oxidoreductase [Ideonella alba]